MSREPLGKWIAIGAVGPAPYHFVLRSENRSNIGFTFGCQMFIRTATALRPRKMLVVPGFVSELSPSIPASAHDFPRRGPRAPTRTPDRPEPPYPCALRPAR